VDLWDRFVGLRAKRTVDPAGGGERARGRPGPLRRHVGSADRPEEAPEAGMSSGVGFGRDRAWTSGCGIEEKLRERERERVTHKAAESRETRLTFHARA